MTAYLAYALDPLLFGTGRPFEAVPGSRAESLPVPPPSTLAGMIRTATGRDQRGRFDTTRIDELLGYSVRGPVLATLQEDLSLQELVFPAPADAVRLAVEGDKKSHRLRRLVPIRLRDGDRTDLDGLAPVGMVPPSPEKPARKTPAFWTVADLLAWLSAPTDQVTWSAERGIHAPTAETRVHVRLGEEGTADDGGLFSTSGRRFFHKPKPDRQTKATRLGLYWETDAPMPEGTVPLGGEGRLAQAGEVSSALPSIPKAVLDSAAQGFVRVYLFTPASFEGAQLPNLTGAQVMAQASARALTISGWDMAAGKLQSGVYKNAALNRKRGGPKPTRRLVPAGAVYFLRLTGTPEQNQALVRERWARSLCPDAQDQRDGFGLALFGTWDGQLHALTTSSRS